MQSLLPADLSDPEAAFRLELRAGRAHHPHLPVTASLLQPFIGAYTDQKPKPYSLPVGMGVTLCGLLLLALRQSLSWSCSRRRWSASAHRSSIRNPRASRAWPQAGSTGWRNPYSRSAAISARRSGRCWPPSSCCRWERAMAWFALRAARRASFCSPGRHLVHGAAGGACRAGRSAGGAAPRR